jgi:hypothetical protein
LFTIYPIDKWEIIWYNIGVIKERKEILMQEKNILRGMCLLTCAKNGYISIKKAKKKLGWSIQKIICVGNLLVENGVLTKDIHTIFNGYSRLNGYYIARF